MESKGSIVIYQAKGGKATIEVTVENETVWLTQKQIAELFGVTQQNISLHVNNIFRTRELDKNSVHKENLYTATDGKNYPVSYYNLDLILSIGYKVNSKRATQFRIWATSVLKEHLIHGFSINYKRLQELQDTVDMQKENYMQLRFFLNKFLGMVARKDVVDILIDRVEELSKNIEEIKKLVARIEKPK